MSSSETSRIPCTPCDIFILFPSQIIVPGTVPQGITLKKNNFGYYEHLETKLVFSNDTKSVVGKQDPSGEIIPLTINDVEICSQMKIPISESASIELSDSDVDSDVDVSDVDSDNGDNEEDNEEDEDDDVITNIVNDHDTRDTTPSLNNLTDAEKEYKEMLIELFVKKWEKKFLNKIEITTYGLSNCKIQNVHGLEFYGYEIIYNPSINDYVIEFFIGKSIDGITPSHGESELFILQTAGPSLKKAFSTILDYINKYIFCKQCGTIRQFDSYSEEHNKCDSCLINDILMLNRKTSEYCTICMESTKNYYTLRCGHKFHRSCLSDLKVKACPNCRKWINEEDGEDDA